MTGAIDGQNIAISLMLFIRTRMMSDVTAFGAGKGRETVIQYEFMHMHTSSSVLSSSGNQGKFIQTVCSETQFATSVFSVYVSWLNSGLIYSFCRMLQLLFLLG